VRARHSHPSRERPVLVNTWEAVYFDHSLPKLIQLAELAADLGVERYVLDDGWFTGRRDDTSSLGDWSVDDELFPDGLTPLVKAVRELGMEFGLWFEPEMVNIDSDLARAHPDWIMGTHAGPGPPSRNQHVLDLANPQAWNHIIGLISDLVDEYDIAYIKWDHNRPVVGAGHGPDRTPGVRGQTLATYRMMEELVRRHPSLEIESCSGGGGRLDLGIMEYASRAWLSDCIDAHERHRMVLWTGALLPLELMGTHIGAEHDHTTGRTHTLDFRAGTAAWGHMGIEWDLTTLDQAQREQLAEWIHFYKRFRGLLHSGRVVHADSLNSALQLEGVVSTDGQQGLFRLSALDLPDRLPAGRVPLPGLDPDTTYQVTAVSPAASAFKLSPPFWFPDGVTRTGRTLAEVGLMPPLLRPDELIFLHAEGRR
jgi:alpha-galactosidase